MIVILNGGFGAGKTTLARALLARRPEWMLFDPEEVGAMLWRLLEVRGDFQDLPQWAPLVVETARVLVATTGKGFVVPMTLLNANYRTVRAGFETIAPTAHFTLVASPETLARRLTEREGVEGTWAHGRIPDAAVFSRPEFALHLDAERPVGELADEVLRAIPHFGI